MRGIKTCLVAFVFALLTASAASADIVYVNAPSGLNLRQLPTVNSKCIQVLPYGTKLVIIDDEPLAGWLMVEGGGYVKGEYTQPEDPQDDMELLGTWKITAYAWTGYTCANGNYPSEGYTVACNSLPFGARVYIEGNTIEGRMNFEDGKWYKMHCEKERHHLNKHCPDDVNLIDVIEMICDCVCAGMARSGSVYPIEISSDILQRAVSNTAEMCVNAVEVEMEEGEQDA